MSFTSTQNKGFRIKFENGFAVSVQWGTMNYCEKQTYNDDIDPTKEKFWESTSAELAIIDSEGGMLPIGDNDTVMGWCSPEKVSQIINVVSTSKDEHEIIKRIKSWEQ